MDKREAETYCKTHLKDYLMSIRPGWDGNPKHPFQCLNPKHNDAHPSCVYFPAGSSKNPTTDTFYCRICKINGKNLSGDIFEAIALENGLDRKTQFKKVAQIAYDFFRLPIDGKRTETGTSFIHKAITPAAKQEKAADYTAFFEECSARIDGAIDYLTQRGISIETAKRLGVGYCPEWRHPKVSNKVPTSPRIIFPSDASHYVARDTRPDKQEKPPAGEADYRKQKVGEAGPPFNMAALKSGASCVFVVEGEFDCLSFEEAGFPAVSTSSTNGAELFVRSLPETPPLLILAYDNDNAGKGATESLVSMLDEKGVNYVSADTSALYFGNGDANDALKKDRERFLSAAKESADDAWEQFTAKAERAVTEYDEKYSALSALDNLWERVNREHLPPAPTGYKDLDKFLDGGLYPGLYVVGAITSIGKTSFAMQAADNIAAHGRPVLVFSIEMGAEELTARSISRLTADNVPFVEKDETAWSTREVLIGDSHGSLAKESSLMKADEKYREFAPNITIVQGDFSTTVLDIQDGIREYMRIKKVSPVVLVDYLQILAPDDPHRTDKQAADFAVKSLKQISRDKEIPIITISSFNRNNYTTKASLAALKESGGIEYSADVVIGLQLYGVGKTNAKGEAVPFDIEGAKKKTPRRVEVLILKNRHGRTGDKFNLSYYPAYNLFSSVVMEDVTEDIPYLLDDGEADFMSKIPTKSL